METTNEHIDDLIIRLLCGELDPEGRQELESWASADAANAKYLHQRQELWFSATRPEELRKYDKEAAYAVFLRRINRKRTSANRHFLAGRQTLRRWTGYAAGILLFCLAGGIGYYAGQKHLLSAFADITIEVPQDSRTRTSLPDGTVVWLNAGSRLAYSQGFGVKDRNVRLEGEGFFEVEKNEQLPFCVHTSSVCVQDLGTAFNFRDYPDDKEAEVILAEGCIRLENLVRKGSPELMKPGDRIVVDKHTGTLVRDTYDANLANQWTGGRLIFDGESIETIARKIEQCYHVSVTLASKGLEDCHFYGTFIRMENSLTEVLDALAATGKVRYRIEGRRVTLYSN